jgi:hypothetical protein
MADILTNIRKQVQAFDFETLFIEDLGWDTNRANHSVTAYNQTYNLKAIAQKRGMVALLCPTIPEYKVRVKIEKEVAKSFRENLIVYANSEKTQQVWQWVRREIHQPIRNREHIYYKGQSGQVIAQPLAALAIDLDEEETLTIVDVTSRVRAAFDVEHITRRFYDRFKREHDSFMAFINGIPDDDLHRWYASVMLNRLMFIYFIQKKGFLAGDLNYLRNKLEQVEGNFYSTFLLPLFFEGFATKKRSLDIQKLLGDIPYLNGGLFLMHQIEERYGEKIQIENVAFERLFTFFDSYNWNLDERPLKNDNEINPDVLGYIFEKYINQKQMGAYYTKEDITEYISKNTVIPYLFDAARKEDKIAFEGEHSVWGLLQESPDRYIYPAVAHGTKLPLPADIEVGIHDVSKRDGWNVPAPDDYALPTEIWREVVSRRQRHTEVRQKLIGGEIRSINDLITYNLDIQQFAQDVIENTDSADLLRAFWKAITTATILDPTCGSGAFLFAALNILEPLYEASLVRMEGFISDFNQSSNPRSQKYADFRAVLERIEQHPNRRYFVLKSIIVNNLFGVDIMEEAVEICKLRLFLKLVSQVDKRENVEPLPDIDFNIRSGNTLVGFATQDEVRKALSTTASGQGKLMFGEDVERLNIIEEKAADIDRLFKRFREQQTELGGEVTTQDKANLGQNLKELEHELNLLLAEQYGVNMSKPQEFDKWLYSHEPFHWFIEFYGTLNDGGFGVIIGNPPYVEYSKIRENYRINGYLTEASGNLYAYVIERSTSILRNMGRMGMIVQLSAICTDRMQSLQGLYLANSGALWASAFDDRPAKLFDGLEHIRATIILNLKERDIAPEIYSTNLSRWYTEIRDRLFHSLFYNRTSDLNIVGSFPKIGNITLESIVRRLRKLPKTIGSVYDPKSKKVIHYHRSPLYWIRSMDFMPHFYSEGSKRSVHHFKDFGLSDYKYASIVGSVINSTLFYMWFIAYGNGRNVAIRDIVTFYIPESLLSPKAQLEFQSLFARVMADFKKHSVMKTRTDGVQYQEFYPNKSKQIINEIDRALAKHFGFTDEELDFIINYDIKYRMGITATTGYGNVEENGDDE